MAHQAKPLIITAAGAWNPLCITLLGLKRGTGSRFADWLDTTVHRSMAG